MSHAEGVHRLPCRANLRASVVLLHGYASAGAAQLADGEAFVGEHTEVLVPDAPGHGSRDDGRLARIAALPDPQRPSAIHAVAREWAGELPQLAASCRQRGARRVGVVGISMGGFAAFATLSMPDTFDAVAAVLAAPLLVDRSRMTAGRPPLLVGLAGRDEAVRPESGRAFALEYGAQLHEYAESDHFMRAGDWQDLWRRVARFFADQLGANGSA